MSIDQNGAYIDKNVAYWGDRCCKAEAEVERLGAALKEIQRATSLEMLATNHGKRGDIANEIATRALNGTAKG
jgi:hypothetical protein